MHHETGTLTPEALRERLDLYLAVTDYRALIVVIVARAGLDDVINAVRDEAITAAGISAEDIITLDLAEDEATGARVRELNYDRDLLLRAYRLVWLRAHNAAEVRFLRSQAPDLTSALDLLTRVEVPDPDADWPTCRDAIRVLMEHRHGTLDFTGLLPNRPERTVMPLDELYLPLVSIKPSLRDIVPEDIPIDAFAALTEEGPTRGWLVLGHPGTGKTTFARHLAWSYATGAGDPLDIGRLAAGEAVPLLLPLADYGRARERDRVQPLVDYLPEWLTEQGIPSASTLSQHLGEVILILDGLDEIRADIARADVLDEASRLAADARVRAVVATGRSLLVDELHARHAPLRVRHTRPPRDEEIARFVTAFSAQRGVPSEHAQDIIARIERDDDLRTLARTPLVLAFMVILDELEGRLPDRRIEIYYRLGEMLVERWTRARSLGRAGRERERPTRGAALRVLGPLAWWTIEQGGAVAEDELLAELTRIEVRRDPEEGAKQARTLLDLLKLDTALLVRQADGRWAFVHLSVAEYFAALHAERSPEIWEAVLADPFRVGWNGIVQFLAGQLGVMEGKVDQLDTLGDALVTQAERAEMNDAHGITMMVAMLREGYGFGHWIQRKMTGQVLRAIFTQSFKGYASLEAQFAVADLLFHARAGLRAVLRELLATWLLDNQQSIRWSHFFEAAWVERVGDIKTIPDEPLVLASRVSDPLKALEYFVPRHWCGPFLASLHHIVVRYDIDPVLVAGPLLDSPDWRLRLIGNLVQRPPRTITEFDALLDRIWPDLEQRPPVYRLTP